MTPEDIISPWMCFPLEEVSHKAEHPAPAQLPLLCSQCCDTEQWLPHLPLLGFNEISTAWKEHLSPGNVIPAPKNHIKETVHLALPSPAWMQTQAGASLCQDFTGHLKDAAAELKGSEENKKKNKDVHCCSLTKAIVWFKDSLKVSCCEKDLQGKAS